MEYSFRMVLFLFYVKMESGLEEILCGYCLSLHIQPHVFVGVRMVLSPSWQNNTLWNQSLYARICEKCLMYKHCNKKVSQQLRYTNLISCAICAVSRH